MIKRCRKCGLPKPLRSFITRNGNESNSCKPCRSARGRINCERYRAQRAETVKRWRLANPERWREIQRASKQRRQQRDMSIRLDDRR